MVVEKKWRIVKSDQSIDDSIEAVPIDTDLKSQVKKASVILMPQEGFRDFIRPVFPVGTSEFLQYLKDKQEGDFTVDIAIDDENYSELALHSELLVLAGLAVRYLAMPILSQAIYDYVKHRLGSSIKDSDVKLDILIEDSSERNKKIANISYEGPAGNTKEVLDAAFNDFHHNRFDEDNRDDKNDNMNLPEGH